MTTSKAQGDCKPAPVIGSRGGTRAERRCAAAMPGAVRAGAGRTLQDHRADLQATYRRDRDAAVAHERPASSRVGRMPGGRGGSGIPEGSADVPGRCPGRVPPPARDRRAIGRAWLAPSPPGDTCLKPHDGEAPPAGRVRFIQGIPKTSRSPLRLRHCFAALRLTLGRDRRYSHAVLNSYRPRGPGPQGAETA